MLRELCGHLLYNVQCIIIITNLCRMPKRRYNRSTTMRSSLTATWWSPSLWTRINNTLCRMPRRRYNSSTTMRSSLTATWWSQSPWTTGGSGSTGYPSPSPSRRSGENWKLKIMEKYINNYCFLCFRVDMERQTAGVVDIILYPSQVITKGCCLKKLT